MIFEKASQLIASGADPEYSYPLKPSNIKNDFKLLKRIMVSIDKQKTVESLINENITCRSYARCYFSHDSRLFSYKRN